MLWKVPILFVLSVLIGAENNENPQLDWWQTSVIYQIYPRSFKDSNTDGIGDLKGIEEQASYFKDTGIGAVWLSPINKSPMIDMGYDISDFTAIDPIFGTMEDFVSLQKKLDSLGIKLILDFVPNHSSDQHEWFKKSVKKVNPYTNYYVWRDPKGWLNETAPAPPNNWVSLFGGSAWKYNEERKQFYLHQFGEAQPDLNYRSKELVEEMKNVLKFWLDKGVHGIRTDSVPYLVEDDKFLDEPPYNKTSAVRLIGKKDYDALSHIYTKDQPESLKILRQFREVLDSYTQKGGPTRLLLTEAYTDIKHTIESYGTQESPIAQIPFNFYLLTELNDSSNAKAFNDTIHLWLDNMPKGRWPNWVIGNHDNSRVSTRFEPSAVDGINMLVQLLPGTAITYQGEEIGMEDTKVRQDQSSDIESPSRDPERTPFQWSSSPHAGFSTISGNTWLPVNPNYYTLNLEAQKKDPKSHYNIYKKLVKLRSNTVFQHGDINTYVVSERVFAFKRSIPEEEMCIIILNLNNEGEHVNLNTCMPDLPGKLNVYIASKNSEYNIGDQINTNDAGFYMRPKSALVLQGILKKETSSPQSTGAASSISQFSLVSVLLLSGILHHFL
ncbi:maltase 2-like [Planococcus citri]|uniref:maltase 2-like n=1 Tax=Planococcus citri TaxID=170843 RepID=UPI0031F808AC